MLLAAATGCSGPPAYDIPEKPCRRSIDPEALKPLLPEGGTFTARVGEDDDVAFMCDMSIKGEIVRIWELRDQSHFDMVDNAMRRYTRSDPMESQVPGDSIIADGVFVSMNPCPARGEKSNYILEITTTQSPSKAKESREALEAFAASYLPEGLKAMGCTE
ncbi:hypothetical protein [Streptomyces sp. C10-9-1]|uniref:hypothetical protein n=1 Tax=Streptomyces sp. C10-9-1 TaxID=1859285 RepID=UPI003F49BC6B